MSNFAALSSQDHITDHALPLRLVFWQATNSQHQAALLNALSCHPAVESVELIVTQPEEIERREMGWKPPEYTRVVVHHAPSVAQIDVLIRTNLKCSVHIFSGIAADPLRRQALEACIRHGACLGVMAEASDWSGLAPTKFLRLAKHVLLRLRYGPYIRFILGIGSLGVQWYQRVGYDPQRVFSFGYFVDVPTLVPDHTHPVPHVLFVARAMDSKGGDLLVDALSRLQHVSWQATLVTEGECRSAWEKRADRLGLRERLTFANFEPRADIARRMAQADVFVLPNKGKEGWGVVVNEALLQGTPVLCTTLTGAKDLISGDRGEVIAPNAEALAGVLERYLVRGPLDLHTRHQIASWAQKNLSGQSGAERLLTILTQAT